MSDLSFLGSSQKKDEVPPFDWKKIKEIDFFGCKHDPELGWVPHPNQQGKEKTKFLENGKWKHYETTWTTNNEGCRSNPGHGDLDNKVIACFGDSFTFSRQVNDHETWPWQLSRQLGVNATNYGMGNYGLDQALLRLERELQKGLEVETIVMGVVPDTISRIVSVWKHYYEYGNTLNFKPRFVYDESSGKLTLIENRINSEEKFKEIGEGKHLSHLRENDYFYTKKFQKDMLSFPYSISLLKNPSRNVKIIGKTLALSMAELGKPQEEKNR